MHCIFLCRLNVESFLFLNMFLTNSFSRKYMRIFAFSVCLIGINPIFYIFLV